MIGYDYKESPHFISDRPEGSGDYLFLLFLTDILIRTEDGSTSYGPGTCILYAPTDSQFYRNPDTGFTNDWIHFTIEDPSILSQLNLNTGFPFKVDNYMLFRQTIRSIEEEYLMQSRHSEMMVDLLIRQMLIELARHQMTSPVNQSDTEKTFRKARSKFISQLDKPWSIDSMAELTGLSRSRFTHVYKTIFSISPKEDLIYERMTLAKYLLLNSTSSINEIGCKAGYDNPYHFSKQFKKSCGITPTAYRNQK